MSKHTPGPWRWEYSHNRKRLELVGGNPRFGETVMCFARWGMSGASPLFWDDQNKVMAWPCEHQEWITPIPGRSHHAHWCATLNHPDAILIQEAPRLLAALEELIESIPDVMHGYAEYEGDEDAWLAPARAAIAAARGEG